METDRYRNDRELRRDYVEDARPTKARYATEITESCGGALQEKSTRESGVLTETERLGQAISELENTVGHLLARIQSVVRDEPKDATDRVNPPVVERPLCHLGNTVRDERRRLQSLIDMLHEITRRVDL